jgi:hypothetical protein
MVRCPPKQRRLVISVFNELYPLGQITDLGDVFVQNRTIVKGRRFTFVLHDGAPKDTSPADRNPGGVATPATRRAEHVTDLHADKMITRTVAAGDEFGNPTTFDGVYSYAGDNPALLAVTDNGDGSAVLAAVGGLGNLGVANVTFTATPTVGDPVVRVDAINVIAGGTETFTFTDSAESEVTPDVPVV